MEGRASIPALMLLMPLCEDRSSGTQAFYTYLPGPSCQNEPAISLKKFFLIILFIFNFSSAESLLLGRLFSSCGEWGLTSSCGAGGLLTAVASLVVEHGSRHVGSADTTPRLQSTGWVVGVHRSSCSAAHGIFPDQGSNLCLLYCQADSLPLSR